ncbi:MAG: hypothetical protein ABIY55_10890 [Kofleriaceae bacterium]
MLAQRAAHELDHGGLAGARTAGQVDSIAERLAVVGAVWTRGVEVVIDHPRLG